MALLVHNKWMPLIILARTRKLACSSMVFSRARGRVPEQHKHTGTNREQSSSHVKRLPEKPVSLLFSVLLYSVNDTLKRQRKEVEQGAGGAQRHGRMYGCRYNYLLDSGELGTEPGDGHGTTWSVTQQATPLHLMARETVMWRTRRETSSVDLIQGLCWRVCRDIGVHLFKRRLQWLDTSPMQAMK